MEPISAITVTVIASSGIWGLKNNTLYNTLFPKKVKVKEKNAKIKITANRNMMRDRRKMANLQKP